MKEIPILFNSEMVRAILDGRKTQTRRPLRQQPDMEHTWRVLPGYKLNHIALPTSDGLIARFNHSYMHPRFGRTVSEYDPTVKSPFGKPEDVLWVRERLYFDADKGWCYWADESLVAGDYSSKRKSCPSIHMPKAACRTKLKVNRVWVEKVQDITTRGICAEGIKLPKNKSLSYLKKALLAQCKFSKLWKSCYPGSWERNNWVWCCEFEVMN